MSFPHRRADHVSEIAARAVQDPTLGPEGYIAGTVKIEGTVSSRRVRCYERASGRRAAETWSNEKGEYRVDGLDASRTYQIIAMDYALEYNAVVADNVQPIPTPYRQEETEELLPPEGIVSLYDGQAGINIVKWRNTNLSQDAVKVYRGSSPLDPENLPAPIAELGPISLSYDDDTVVEGEVYYYRVSAHRGEEVEISAEYETTEIGGAIITGLEWEMLGENVDGGQALDTAYRGAHAVIPDSVSLVTGKVGDAFAFTAVEGLATTDTVSPPTGRQWSVSAWIYPDATQANSRILDFPDNFSVYIYQMELSINNYAGTSAGVVAGAMVTDKEWTHVVFSFDEGEISFWVNGVLQGVGQAVVGDYVTNSNLIVGQRQGGGSEFNGMIDQVRLTYRPLTSDEVQVLYNEGA